jgi:hypothetical protein
LPSVKRTTDLKPVVGQVKKIEETLWILWKVNPILLMNDYI